MNDTMPLLERAPWRSTPRARSVLTFCAAAAAVLPSTPALASDPTGTLSGLYAFLVLLAWLALNLVLTVVIAIKGGYWSAAWAKWHAAVGASVGPAGGVASGVAVGVGVGVFFAFFASSA